jgi:hypothetical protein
METVSILIVWFEVSKAVAVRFVCKRRSVKVVELVCASLLLLGTVSESRNTVGVLGYRESVLGHKVMVVHPGSPLSGLVQPGDNVVAVNGNKNKYNTRGEPGTSVTLTVKRKRETFDVTVRRVAVQELENRYLNHYFGVND